MNSCRALLRVRSESKYPFLVCIFCSYFKHRLSRRCGDLNIRLFYLLAHGASASPVSWRQPVIITVACWPEQVIFGREDNSGPSHAYMAVCAALARQHSKDNVRSSSVPLSSKSLLIKRKSSSFRSLPRP